jgi:hypothetical protein
MLLRHATVLHHFSEAFAPCHLLCHDLINGGSCSWPTGQKATCGTTVNTACFSSLHIADIPSGKCSLLAVIIMLTGLLIVILVDLACCFALASAGFGLNSMNSSCSRSYCSRLQVDKQCIQLFDCLRQAPRP